MTYHGPLPLDTPVLFQTRGRAILGRIRGFRDVGGHWMYGVLLDTKGFYGYIETDENWITALVH